MPAQTLDILIQIDSRLRGLEETQKQLKQASAEARKLEADGKKAASALGTGFAVAITDRLVSGLQSAGRQLAQFIADGVRFNATIESSTIGIAGVLKQFDKTGRFKDFNAAVAESARAIDLLKEKAKVSPATFEQLVQGFQGLSGAFASAGLKMTEQVDLVVLMSQALAGLGIRSEQLLQESRALVTGNINEDSQAARFLEITRADIEGAKAKGQLFQFLTERLAAFGEAGKVAANSLNTQFSNLDDALTQLKGVATTEVFKELKTDLGALIEILNSPQAAQGAAGFAAALGGLIDGAKATLKVLEVNSAGVSGISDTPKAERSAFAQRIQDARVAKLREQNRAQEESLARQVAEARNVEDADEAVLKLQRRIVEAGAQRLSNDEDIRAEGEYHQQILTGLLNASTTLVFSQEKTAGAVASQSAEHAKIVKVLGDQLALTKAEAEGNTALVETLRELQRIDEVLAKLNKDRATATAEEFNAARQLVGLQNQIDDQKAQKSASESLKKASRAGLSGAELLPALREDADEARAASDALRLQLFGETDASKITAEQVGALSRQKFDQIAKATEEAAQRTAELEAGERQAAAAAKEFQRSVAAANETAGDLTDKTRSRAEHERDVARIIESESEKLKGLGFTHEEIAAYAEREVTNQEEKKKLLESQRDVLKDERDILREINSEIGAVRSNPFLTTEQKQGQLSGLLGQQREALLARGGDNKGALDQNKIDSRLNTFGGTLEADFKQFTNNLGSAAENTASLITGTLGSAIDGVSGSLTALITGTGDWRDVANSSINGIISDLIRLGIQTIAHYALQEALQATGLASSAAAQTAAVGTATASGAAIAGAYAPASAAVNTATFGAGASTGTVIALASISAIIGAIVGASAFKTGGYTGGGATSAIAGVVHGGEYVFSAPAVRRLGVANLENMHTNARGYSSGGAVDFAKLNAGAAGGGGGGAAKPMAVHVHFDEREMMKRIRENPDVQNMVVRVGRTRGAEMGRRG